MHCDSAQQYKSRYTLRSSALYSLTVVTMSLPTSSELDPLLTRQDHRQLSCCCKLSYKPRKFSSKGAVLVLVWQFLVFCGVYFAYTPPHIDQSFQIGSSLLAVGLIITAIISGWLADTKVGRSRVVQTGLFITWLGVVLMTASRIPVHTLSVQTTSSAVKDILLAVQYALWWCSSFLHK